MFDALKKTRMAQDDDYIPGEMAKFNGWQKNFYAVTDANKNAWAVSGAKFAELTDPQSDFEDAYDAWEPTGTRSPVISEALDVAFDAYVAVIRPFVQTEIRNNKKIDDDDLLNLGIPPIDDEKTELVVPVTAPLLSITRVDNQLHKLKVQDKEQPDFSGIPNGVDHIHIRRFIGETPPTNPEEWPFYKDSSRARIESTFDPEDENNRAHYRIRYVSPTGIMGPWSDVVSEVIA